MTPGPHHLHHRPVHRGRTLFVLFLALEFFQLSRQIWISLLGDFVAPIATASNGLAAPVLVASAWHYAHAYPHRLIARARRWIVTLATTCTVLFIYGVCYRHLYFFEALEDYSVYLIIMSGVVLGAIPQFWRDAFGPLFWCFACGLLLNGLAMLDYATVSSAVGGDGTRIAARDTMAYKAQLVLGFWMLLLMTSPLRRRTQVFTILAGVGFVFLQALLFQQRLPSAFVMANALVFLWLVRLARRRRELSARKPNFALLLIVIAGLAPLTAAIVAPATFNTQAQALILRFRGLGPGLDYSNGIFSVLTVENERAKIVGECFSSFTVTDWILGRGMGGAYEWSGSWDLAGRSDLEEQTYYLPDAKFYGRRSFEVGFLMPALKGGILLMAVLYYGPLVLLWRNRRVMRPNLFTQAATACVVGSLVYSVMGGNFLLAAVYMLTSWSLCLGWCLSRDRNTNPLQLPKPGAPAPLPKFPARSHA